MVLSLLVLGGPITLARVVGVVLSVAGVMLRA